MLVHHRLNASYKSVAGPDDLSHSQSASLPPSVCVCVCVTHYLSLCVFLTLCVCRYREMVSNP